MKKVLMSPFYKSVFVTALLVGAVSIHVSAKEKLIMNAPATLTLNDDDVRIESSELILIEKSIDLDFPGGSIAAFRAAVNRVLPDLNILVKGDSFSRSVSIPPMTMKNVDCQQLATCLEEIAGISWHISQSEHHGS